MLLPCPTQLATNICSGAYEPACIALLQSLIGATDVCYDIGGHNGYFSLVLAKLADRGRVVCFEPVQELADRIVQSIQQSKLTNACVQVIAVAGEVGQMQFRFAGDDRLDDSMGYLVRYGGVNTPRSRDQYGQFSERSVASVTLDSLTEVDPNFIKIDAEGAEADILQAGQLLIARCKPRMLIEIHGVDLAIRCACILGPLGYRGYAVGERSLMMSVLWIHCDDRAAAKVTEQYSTDEMPLIVSLS